MPGQVWQVNAHGFDVKDPICFHVSNSEHVSATNHENHYVPPLTVFTDGKPYLFAVYHTSPGGGRKTHLQVESLLPRLSTDFSVIKCNQVGAGFRAFGGLVSRVSGLV